MARKKKRKIRVGDIVRIKQWNLCLWEVTRIDEYDTITIKVLGGHALPPEWGPTSHCVSSALIRVLDKEMSELAVFTMASMDCNPKTRTSSA